MEYKITDAGGGLYIARAAGKSKPVFNKTNDSIEWAKWSWNPVTGCFHSCPWCYARDIAQNDRYKEAYPKGFAPMYHPDRLDAVLNTKIPKSRKDEPGIKNVFVCSMADLFGSWVPAEWIQSVIDATAKRLDFNFLFLTKNPKRYLEFNFPVNAWLGATADTAARYQTAIEAFEELRDMKSSSHSVTFLSCEPLSEYLYVKAKLIAEPLVEPVFLSSYSVLSDRGKIFDLPFDWAIIGGFKDGRQPDWSWVENILFECRKAGKQVYFKPNLTVRPKEYPSRGTK